MLIGVISQILKDVHTTAHGAPEFGKAASVNIVSARLR